jgi:hypothetical protein
MANIITNDKANLELLHLSNLSMALLFEIWALSVTDAASSDWENLFALWVVDQDQDLTGLGMASFDIEDIPWTIDNFDIQKVHVLKTLEMAINQHRWESLPYEPIYPDLVIKWFSELQNLVNGFQQTYIQPNKEKYVHTVSGFEKCAIHQVYLHRLGCIICNNIPTS